ncbi:transcriptional regulator, AraC family [Collimonas sp. OK607]|uniref:AraC family transcriptional regulator n=1 Tax=Collimonas sp. OK607 TaxID=1798194 RepID=UPI0008E2C8E0|nr:AraC family transcriptional regulator [Collimonas sp. OK607]SFB10562.1 transcriptional regulator, AraC family [Collimonas sp. OK607]
MKDQVKYNRSAETPGLILSEAHFSEFSFAPHYHLDYHIALVTEGVQRQEFRGESLILTPGTIQLMPPGEVHDGAVATNQSYTLKTFRLSPDLLSRLAADVTGKDRFPTLSALVIEDPALARHLARMHESFVSGQDDSPLQHESRLLTLFENLFGRARILSPSSTSGTLSVSQLRRIRDYCEAQLAQKITLDELAKVIGLGRFQFLKFFKRTVGMTPHAWLLRMRLERACALLNRPDRCLTQVAQEIGFYDQSHFNRAFRQAFGVAPSQY